MSSINDNNHVNEQQPAQTKQPQPPPARRKKKDDNPHKYQSGMRPSIVTTINNTNPNNVDSSISTRIRQRANEPYESYIEDSFVGHWEHEDDEDEYQEDFDADSQDGHDEKSELKHPASLEFDFDSFGPESIIYSPPTASTGSTTINSNLTSGIKGVGSAKVCSRPPTLLEVSPEAENADTEDDGQRTAINTDQIVATNKESLNKDIINETPELQTNTDPSSSRNCEKPLRVSDYNFPTQEYLIDPAQIDLKVIEPYKKVISHAGYCNHFDSSVPGEPTPPGKQPPAVIVFSACYLPDRSRRDYNYVMDHLFLYVLTSLHELIADDYILIYLHNTQPTASQPARSSSGTSTSVSSTIGSSSSIANSSDEGKCGNNLPTFTWMKRCYQMIDRRLRKNLRILYLVKPTFWLKTIVIMCKPFISTKFSKKLRFVEDMNALRKCMPVDKLILPASAEGL